MLLLLFCRKHLTFYGLVAYLLVAVGGCRCDSIPSWSQAKAYVVKFATDTGEWVTEKAKTVSDAISLFWDTVFPKVEDGVRVDPANPLRGTLQGTLMIIKTFKDGNRTDEIVLKLHYPRMYRECEQSPWKIDPEELPEWLRSETKG